MKHVEIIHSKIPTFRVPIHGLPPLSGWAVRYVSGMEGTPDIEPGDWLSQWHVGADDVAFYFEHGLRHVLQRGGRRNASVRLSFESSGDKDGSGQGGQLASPKLEKRNNRADRKAQKCERHCGRAAHFFDAMSSS